MTAVGLSAAETAASVRSATTRFVQTHWRDHRFEPFTVAEVSEEGLGALKEGLAGESGLTGRETRLLRLATGALAECLQPLTARPAFPPLFVALPDCETTVPLDDRAFLRRLAEQTDRAFDPSLSRPMTKGRAGGLTALGVARQEVESGRASFALAGGVDTYRDPYVLGTLDLQKRVKSSAHLDGFVPGEAAAFLLLGSERSAAKAGISPLCRLSRVTEGVEEGHLQSDQPYKGEGLANAVSRFLEENPPAGTIATVYSSMNGENYWAKEWGVAYLRNRAAFSEDPEIHHPADCFGDVGAATGPLLVGLAMIGIRGGYRRGPAVVYCSSDGGARAVMSLSAG